MYLTGIRVTNYKSFADSGVVSLSPGFNVILGQNNSGKTALLQALRHQKNENIPHRDLTFRPEGASKPQSAFQLRAKFEAQELFDQLMTLGQTIWVPVAGPMQPDDIAKTIFRKNGVELTAPYVSGSSNQAPYPSHGLFQHETNRNQTAFAVNPNPDKQDFKVTSASHSGTDNLLDLGSRLIAKKVFLFDAERLRTAKTSLSSPIKLATDASNLPRALFQMQSSKDLWEEFNSLVNRVLPSVRWVSVMGDEGQTDVEVRLWPVDPQTRRNDLVVSLAGSGSGVSQVLAILCAAMTTADAVIGIDEPGNFLHPGAIRTLLEILKQFPHQYVITTHSLDAVVTANPKSVYMVEWADCVSSVRPANLHSLPEHRRVLAELGVSLSDVFGMDNVLWVEGETEEQCAPIVIQDTYGYMPSTTVVLRVRSVSELLDKKGADDVLWDIYRRLSSTGGLVPTKAKFLFDREGRSDAKMAQLEKESQGTVVFFKRRTYENYLLHPPLWVEELNAECEAHNSETRVALPEVLKWLDENAARWDGKVKWAGNIQDEDWKRAVDAPALLKKLFWDLAVIEYRKTRHSPSLTRRLLHLGGADAEELRSLILSCVA